MAALRRLIAHQHAVSHHQFPATTSPSYPLVEKLKGDFLAKYPGYIFESSSIFGSHNSTYKVVQFPKKAAVVGEVPQAYCYDFNAQAGCHFLGAQWQCCCGLWTSFLDPCSF